MLIDDLKSLKNPTFQEQGIIDYLIANPEIVEKTSVADIAALTYSSASTVIRLCKKVGTKGYPDFKLRWVQELHSLNMQLYIDTSKDLLHKDDTPSYVLNIMPKLYNRVVYETSHLIDKRELKKALHFIDRAEIINIYGSSVNYEAAKNASYNFSTLGYTSNAFHSNNVQYINNISKRYPGKVASIIISHTGMNPEMIQVFNNLKMADIPCIVMTGNKESKLAELADSLLMLYQTDNILSLSNITYKISLNYVLDTLYVLLFNNDFDFQAQNALKNFIFSIEESP